MKFRLLVDLEVVEFMKTLSRAEQRLLQRRFRQIQDSPTSFTDYHEYAKAGHRVEISICSVNSTLRFRATLKLQRTQPLQRRRLGSAEGPGRSHEG